MWLAQALRRPPTAAAVAAAAHEEVDAALASNAGQQVSAGCHVERPGISYVRCIEDSPGTGPE